MIRAVLEGPADFAGWRKTARMLLRRDVAPEDVAWTTDGDQDSLFSDENGSDGAASGQAMTVPRVFVDLAGQTALHSDPERFALLYRLLWRLRTERHLLDLASDPDVSRAGALAKAVRRDIHKMHAFVRFRAVTAADDDRSTEHYIAWYEPQHHVVEAAAPFFMRRFANVRWTILTPERSADWDGAALIFGPGGTLAAAPREDALEELWRGYYANIFNPARVNPEAMRAEMPKRFWRNLPEASLIAPLIREAPLRAREMVERMPPPPAYRRGAEDMPKEAQDTHPPEGIDGLRQAAADCRACPLWASATQTVFGEGPTAARVMFVGEQPGDAEDIKGRPFVGPAGQVFDRAMAHAGIDRNTVYVTNAVKHFKFVPRGKRRIHQKPGSVEIQACERWLQGELQAVEPPLVVALGATAAQALFGRAMAIGRNRGRLMPLGERQALITVHPSYLLRLPDATSKDREYRAFVDDLGIVARFLADGAPGLER